MGLTELYSGSDGTVLREATDRGRRNAPKTNELFIRRVIGGGCNG